MLEVFNSDAPARERRGAMGECFGKDVEIRTLGKNVVTTKGAGVLDAVAGASDRVERAEPRLRVFMEAEKGPTMCLDVYAADETPGISAVVKGQPAPTVVLYRVAKNLITHAWLAPDRDGFLDKWAAVTEDDLLQSKAMTHVNTILTDDDLMCIDEEKEKPSSWELHFHNYHPTHVPTI